MPNTRLTLEDVATHSNWPVKPFMRDFVIEKMIEMEARLDALEKGEEPPEDNPFASPQAKALAEEKGLDPSAIKATGETGITKVDVENHLKEQAE